MQKRVLLIQNLMATQSRIKPSALSSQSIYDYLASKRAFSSLSPTFTFDKKTNNLKPKKN